MRPDPCSCGSPLPTIHLQGRMADMLHMYTENGELVSIPPLTFGTLADRTTGIKQFQIVQTSPTTLRVRLRLLADVNPEQVWQSVHDQISHLLAERQLSHISIERAEEFPEQSPSGKIRMVIPL
jgi:phenylacetate-CoA ligase